MTKANFLKSAHNSLKMSCFLFLRLPGAWFMGVRLRELNDEFCTVALPYRWRSQNPFRSIYFAAQCSAAEFASGMLAQLHLQEKPPVSMLVVGLEAEFLKKAGADLLFTCADGREIQAAIDRALATREGQIVRATSLGTLPDGTLAARFHITWSFRAK